MLYLVMGLGTCHFLTWHIPSVASTMMVGAPGSRLPAPCSRSVAGAHGGGAVVILVAYLAGLLLYHASQRGIVRF